MRTLSPRSSTRCWLPTLDKVELYRAGKTGLLGFFVGQVLRTSQGKANPVVVQRLLEARLG